MQLMALSKIVPFFKHTFIEWIFGKKKLFFPKDNLKVFFFLVIMMTIETLLCSFCALFFDSLVCSPSNWMSIYNTEQQCTVTITTTTTRTLYFQQAWASSTYNHLNETFKCGAMCVILIQYVCLRAMMVDMSVCLSVFFENVVCCTLLYRTR